MCKIIHDQPCSIAISNDVLLSSRMALMSKPFWIRKVATVTFPETSHQFVSLWFDEKCSNVHTFAFIQSGRWNFLAFLPPKTA